MNILKMNFADFILVSCRGWGVLLDEWVEGVFDENAGELP